MGRYTEVKRIPLLVLRARAREERFGRPVPLVLLGGFLGREGEHPLQVVRETGDDDVFLAGWRGHADLPAGLNAADLLVPPSVREQFGQVLVESMAAACRRSPWMRTDREIVEDGETGWPAPPDDEDALVEALVEAVADDDERARRAEEAYEDARAKYSWPALAERVARVYDDVINSAGRLPILAAVTSVPYRIRRSDRARHARILVGGDGVEVVVPRRFPMREVEPFVEEKRPWIERTLRRLAESELPRRVSRTAASFPIWGSGCRCVCGSSAAASGRTWPGAGRGRRRGPDAAGLRDAVERWYAARRGSRSPRAWTPPPPGWARAAHRSRSAASERAGPAARRPAR